MFQFPHLPPTRGGSGRINAQGLPHSDSTGSRPDCGSPVVSLLVCVLHRLVVPRHPPPAHHVLPGHGVLGSRGSRPRQFWLGVVSSLPCGSYPPTPSSLIFAIATYALGKVRHSERMLAPCPLTCATCVPAPSLGTTRGLVWETRQMALASLQRSPIPDC